MLINQNVKLDPRIIRTRRLITQSFKDLLSEKGFQAITVQDITDRATVNRVTFYAHFEDKYALLEYMVRDMFKEWLNKNIPENSTYNQENLVCLITTVCEFLDDIDRHCSPNKVQFDPLMEKQIKNELADTINEWFKNRNYLEKRNKNQPFSPDLAAMVVSWAIYGAAVNWNQSKSSESAIDFSKRVLPLILCIFEA